MRHHPKFNGRCAAKISVSFQRHRILIGKRVNANDSALRDAHFGVVDMTPAVNAR
jgi:hypothetical protein